MRTDDKNENGPEPPANTADAGGPADDINEKRLEMLEAENDRLKATIREARAREDIISLLRRTGAYTPSLLFDAVRADIQFAENDTAANAEALVKRLQRQFPEQFAGSTPGTIDGGAGRTLPPVLTKEALRRMTSAEIAKLDWALVRRALSEK